jgi:hypothetical protein
VVHVRRHQAQSQVRKRERERERERERKKERERKRENERERKGERDRPRSSVNLSDFGVRQSWLGHVRWFAPHPRSNAANQWGRI